MKILAVDDDKTILELLSETLDITGFSDVSTANSATEALDLLAHTDLAFDCFLLDIQMPGMDGIELCGKIRALPGYADAPIVMVTAMSQKAYVDKAFMAGATDYVTKPFDILELGTRLNLAQKLVKERAIARDSLETVTSLKAKAASAPKVGLSEPFEISGIDRSVGYIAFENYVSQLSRGSLFLSGVCGIKIAGITRFHEGATELAYRDLLKSVAAILSEVTQFDGSLFAHCGNGTFICLRQSGNKHKHHDLRAAIAAGFEDLKARYSGQPHAQDLDLVLGDQASMTAFSKATSLNSIHRAIEAVENKCLELKEINLVLDRKHKAEESSDAERDQRRQGYEAMLLDCLHESGQIART